MGRGKVTATRSSTANDIGGKRQISWTELGQHQSVDSCWIAIEGQVYDVTDFSKYAYRHIIVFSQITVGMCAEFSSVEFILEASTTFYWPPVVSARRCLPPTIRSGSGKATNPSLPIVMLVNFISLLMFCCYGALFWEFLLLFCLAVFFSVFASQKSLLCFERRRVGCEERRSRCATQHQYFRVLHG
jgi:hypothetical protein